MLFYSPSVITFGVPLSKAVRSCVQGTEKFRETGMLSQLLISCVGPGSSSPGKPRPNRKPIGKGSNVQPRMRKTARPVVWKGQRSQSPCPHPISERWSARVPRAGFSVPLKSVPAYSSVLCGQAGWRDLCGRFSARTRKTACGLGGPRSCARHGHELIN